MGEPATQPLVFELTLERASDPIRGSVSLSGSLRRSFTGWLGLVAAVEGLADAQAAAATGEEPATSSAS